MVAIKDNFPIDRSPKYQSNILDRLYEDIDFAVDDSDRSQSL